MSVKIPAQIVKRIHKRQKTSPLCIGKDSLWSPPPFVTFKLREGIAYGMSGLQVAITWRCGMDTDDKNVKLFARQSGIERAQLSSTHQGKSEGLYRGSRIAANRSFLEPNSLWRWRQMPLGAIRSRAGKWGR